MATLFAADFEEGDMSDWDAITEFNSGTVTVDEASKRSGTYGCKCYTPTPGSTDRRAYGITTSVAGDECYLDVYLNINNVTMADGDMFFLIYEESAYHIGWVQLRRDGANYEVELQYRDGGNQTSAWTAISKTNWFRLRFHHFKGTGADGIAKWWVDDVLVLDVTDADNDEVNNIEEFNIGFRHGLENGTEGTIYIDDVYLYDGEPVAATILPQMLQHHGG